MTVRMFNAYFKIKMLPLVPFLEMNPEAETEATSSANL
jgi:hypothetical protein